MDADLHKYIGGEVVPLLLNRSIKELLTKTLCIIFIKHKTDQDSVLLQNHGQITYDVFLTMREYDCLPMFM